MAILVRWMLISLLTLASAMALGCLVLAVCTLLIVPQGPGGIRRSEFFLGVAPLIALSGGMGLLALVGTSLYWLVGMRWARAVRPTKNAEDARLLKVSLALVPLGFALTYAISQLITVGPSLLPQPGG